MLFPFRMLAAATLFVSSLSAGATSLQEFRAKSDKEQAAFVSSYIEKMRNDIAAKNPELATAIWNYFLRQPEGKPLSQGFEDLLAQELKVDALAKQGKADLSKVQIEGMIVYVVKQHFRT